jgi:hypothetical protein
VYLGTQPKSVKRIEHIAKKTHPAESEQENTATETVKETYPLIANG